MRPFKFFFSISLGVIVFFFLARFIVAALFIAAILSLLFYVGRRLSYFFRDLSWQDDATHNDRSYNWRYSKFALPAENREWYFDQVYEPGEFKENYRTIEIQ
jgi:hypothetical protein